MINFPIKRANNRVMSPLREVENLQREMDQLFDLTFPGLWNGGGSPDRGHWVPSLDVVDEENQTLILLDLPGMTKKDIKVSVEGKTLTIEGERRRDKRLKDEDHLRSERYYGVFCRRIALPVYADTSKIQATFRDGVLEVRLPKKEDHKPKQIEIQIE